MYISIFFNLSQSSESLNKTIKYYKSGEANKTAMASLARQTFGCKPFSWQIATTYHCCLGGPGCHGTGRGKTLAFSVALAMDKEEIIVIISPLSSLTIEQMVNTPIFHCGYMP